MQISPLYYYRHLFEHVELLVYMYITKPRKHSNQYSILIRRFTSVSAKLIFDFFCVRTGITTTFLDLVRNFPLSLCITFVLQM